MFGLHVRTLETSSSHITMQVVGRDAPLPEHVCLQTYCGLVGNGKAFYRDYISIFPTKNQ